MTVHDTDISEVAEIERKLTEAILADDGAFFAACFAPDCLVHAPHNKVIEGKDSMALFKAGIIAYSSFEQHVERRTKMGDFTDVWGREGGQWKLKLRQATIIAVE